MLWSFRCLQNSTMDHSATFMSIAHFSNEGSGVAAEQFNLLAPELFF